MKAPCVLAGLILTLVIPVFAQEAPPAPKTYQIPYRLTNTKHLLIRARIDGKGPFHFILDSGAPVLFVSPAACRAARVEPDAKGWGVLERFELEGGLALSKVRGRIEEPQQLQGMNALGIAGAELHGVLGYSLIAPYRIEIDLTRDKMTWTELDFKPERPQGHGKAKAAMTEMPNPPGMASLLGGLLGKKPRPEPRPRGFLGMDVEDAGGAVAITSLLPTSPADREGLRAGDLVTRAQGKPITLSSQLRKILDTLGPGDKLPLTIQRQGNVREVVITLGEGL